MDQDHLGHRVYAGDPFMKIRYLAIVYTLLLLLSGLFLWNRIGKENGFSIDMLELNTKAGKISEEILALDMTAEESFQSEVGKIEEEYDCRITFLSDKNYESVNSRWIRDGMSVFDVRENGVIVGKIAFDTRPPETKNLAQKQKTQLLYSLGAAYLAGMLLILVIWYFYIRPFRQLSSFASSVSKGNLDLPLQMTRHNYFGAFTESFDRMREELKKASDRENAANRSKKELVAELSHDIKTPVATIKATCEVMEVKYKDPDMLEKVDVIKSKASSVEQLVDNLFKATLEEMEELKVEQREESSLIISDMLNDLRFYGEVKVRGDIPQCLIIADKLRLSQVIDNIAGNSFKYAKTPLEVEFSSDEKTVHVLFSDRGPGVPEEEIPLLTSKFYRGSGVAGKDGSGLGLYLAAVFMERMGGGLEVRNRDGGGFTVEIVLKKV